MVEKGKKQSAKRPKLPPKPAERLPRHGKRKAQFTMVTHEDLLRCPRGRMLAPWIYLRMRTGAGYARMITIDEIRLAIQWPTNTVVKGVQDLIDAGMVDAYAGPGGMLRYLYAVDPESLPPLEGFESELPDEPPDTYDNGAFVFEEETP